MAFAFRRNKSVSSRWKKQKASESSPSIQALSMADVSKDEPENLTKDQSKGFFAKFQRLSSRRLSGRSKQLLSSSSNIPSSNIRRDIGDPSAVHLSLENVSTDLIKLSSSGRAATILSGTTATSATTTTTGITSSDSTAAANAIVYPRKSSLSSSNQALHPPPSNIKSLPSPTIQLWKYVLNLYSDDDENKVKQENGLVDLLSQTKAQTSEEIIVFKSVVSLWDKNCEISPVHCSLLSTSSDATNYSFRIRQLPTVHRSSSNHVGLALAQAQTIAQAGGSSRYYATNSLRDRDLWMNICKRALKKDWMNERRVENSLHLCIQELKGAAAKKKYYCEVYLDKNIQARTSIKVMTDMLLWAEVIDLRDVPKSDTLSISLRIAGDPKKRKERSDPIVGTVQISINQLMERDQDMWYPLQLQTNHRNSKFISLFEPSSTSTSSASHDVDSSSNRIGITSGQMPMIRLRARWRSVCILPLSCYLQLRNYLDDHCLTIIKALEQAGVSPTAKNQEELSRHLVKILHYDGRVVNFLLHILLWELDKQKEETLVLRGNSMASKSMESYLCLLADQYLKDTLSDFVQKVLNSKDDCEVDSSRISSSHINQIEQRRSSLTELIENVWMKIRTSNSRLPKELRDIFIQLRESVESIPELSTASPKERNELHQQYQRRCFHAISACLFLRLICPAILSPSLFGLTDQYPDDQRVNRTLTLVAKVIQSLANGNTFGQKEGYMLFLNPLLQHNLTHMRHFLESVSEPLPEMLFGPSLTDNLNNHQHHHHASGIRKNSSNSSTRQQQQQQQQQHRASPRRHRPPLIDTSEQDGIFLKARIDIAYELACVQDQLHNLLMDISPERLNPTLRGLQNILHDLKECKRENHSHSSSSEQKRLSTPFSIFPPPPPSLVQNNNNKNNSTSLSQSASNPSLLPMHDYDDPFCLTQDVLLVPTTTTSTTQRGAAAATHQIVGNSLQSMSSLLEEAYSSGGEDDLERDKNSLIHPYAIHSAISRPSTAAACLITNNSTTIQKQQLQQQQPITDVVNYKSTTAAPATAAAPRGELEKRVGELRAECLREEAKLKLLRSQLIDANRVNLEMIDYLRSLPNFTAQQVDESKMTEIIQLEDRAKQGLLHETNFLVASKLTEMK